MKFFLSSLLALSAIGFAFAEENTTSTDETCNNGVKVIKKHIGEKYTQEIGDETGVKDIRVVSPGDPVTMDHNPARLNVYVSDSNVIGKAYCG